MRKYLNLSILILIFILGLSLIGCTKEVPKELLNQNQTNDQMPTGEMPDDSIHRNLKNPEGHDEEASDEKVAELTKQADDADAKYMKTKSEADKKEAINKQLIAANYLMFEANLSPKKKYRPALKRYNRILELDPTNEEAKQNKQQIEEIYEQMGVPVPTS